MPSSRVARGLRGSRRLAGLDAPGQVIVVGPAPETADWDPGSPAGPVRLRPRPEGRRQTGPPAVGRARRAAPRSGRLLRSPGPAGGRGGRAGGALRRTGEQLAAFAPRAVMLVMGDGSARRSPFAPGHLDERAVPFDAQVERAVRDGDLDALAALDPALARELMATGRPAWQVLAGAWGPGNPSPRSCTRTRRSAWPTWSPILRPRLTALPGLVEADQSRRQLPWVRSGRWWVRWCSGARRGWSRCGSRAGAARVSSRRLAWRGGGGGSGARRCTHRWGRLVPRESRARSRSGGRCAGRAARCTRRRGCGSGAAACRRGRARGC